MVEKTGDGANEAVANCVQIQPHSPRNADTDLAPLFRDIQAMYTMRGMLAEWSPHILLALDLLVLIVLSVRVVMRRRSVGFSLAWLTVLFSVPIFGAILYLLLGELRLGGKRAKLANLIHGPYQQWLAELRDPNRSPAFDARWEPLARLAESAVAIPPLCDNRIELLADADSSFQTLLSDIESARSTVHLEFYIWDSGGRADAVASALERAAKRGVKCRILLDDVGSRKFLRSQAAQNLRAAGVEVEAALPANLLRAFFVRFDLRLHRKIVVIDGEIGYAGSLNVADPLHFKRATGYGPFLDAMVRLHGPVVEALAVTFLEDWELETGATFEQLRVSGDVKRLAAAGESTVHVIPSGPMYRPLSIQEILLWVIYGARDELILTTPYYIPDEALQAALIAAARRGVEVTLIVPVNEDSHLVRYASQAYRGELVAAGVHVLEHQKGMLHTKSVTVDGQVSLFGSLNLDPRSMFLNFEITLAIYDPSFTESLRELQRTYGRQCRPLDLAAWRSRPWTRQFAQNLARLLGPLL
jgi:cardiolipin synthase